MKDKMERLAALREYLEVDELPVTLETVQSYFGSGLFVMFNDDNNTEYYVLTDEEANDAAEAYIEDGLWAFNPSFLKYHVLQELKDENVAEVVIESIQKHCRENDANKALKSLVINFDNLVEDAIARDTRGNFISNYDGTEYTSGDYFIYRMN